LSSRLDESNPQCCAESKASPTPDGALAQTLKQLHKAWTTYQQLTRLMRRRLPRVQHDRPLQTETPYLELLDEQQRAALEAVRADALEFARRGLSDPQRRADYQSAPDPNGERARRLERLHEARTTYQRSTQLGRRRLRRVEQPPTWMQRLPLLGTQQRADYEGRATRRT
jgi:hypothetical protein